jgi:hypothetical protein
MSFSRISNIIKRFEGIDSEKKVPISMVQKILAPHDGPLHVLLTCSKPVCRAFLPWATSEAAALSALLLLLAKDQLQFHLFTKYSENREQIDQKFLRLMHTGTGKLKLVYFLNVYRHLD